MGSCAGKKSTEITNPKKKNLNLKKKAQVIFINGGPGSGKGTQCEKMVSLFNFNHLSTGDLLRHEKTTGSENAKMIEEYIKEGKLIPSSLVVELIKNAIDKKESEGIFLIDGFPRNQENLDVWNKLMGEIAEIRFLIYFDCCFDVMKERLLERGKTSGRSDDNEEVIKKRLETFQEETKPILEHFKNLNLLRSINAEREIKDIFDDVTLTLRKEKIIPELPNIIFVSGGPGSGKGTQCLKMIETFKFNHLSTGDLLREEKNSGSENAETINNLINEGKLVPSSMVVDLVEKAIIKKGNQGFFLIDGYPRNQENLDVWNEKMSKKCVIRFLLFFECSFEVMEQRIIERGKTSQRTDDNPETVKKRFNVFEEETKPIIESFKKNGQFICINSERSVEVVWEDTQKSIRENLIELTN